MIIGVTISSTSWTHLSYYMAHGVYLRNSHGFQRCSSIIHIVLLSTYKLPYDQGACDNLTKQMLTLKQHSSAIVTRKFTDFTRWPRSLSASDWKSQGNGSWRQCCHRKSQVSPLLFWYCHLLSITRRSEDPQGGQKQFLHDDLWSLSETHQNSKKKRKFHIKPRLSTSGN